MAIQQTPELERALQSAADRKASDLFLLPDEPISFRVKDRIVRGDGDALSEAEVRAIVTEAADFATNDAEPDVSELWTDIYAEA